MPEYVFVHRDRRGAGYDPERNPDGYIGLCVAENSMMWDHLAPWMSGPYVMTPDVTGYGDMRGSPDLREVVADLVSERIFGRRVDPDWIVTMAGAGAVLEALFHAIADPGEGVLVPTPSYAGFWPDVEARNHLHVVPVERDPDNGYALTTDLLDRAVDRAPMPVRTLLYTNPDNPLGDVASAEQVGEIVAWCRSRGLHLVSDEIYALSVFGDGVEFSGAGSTPLGDDVHVVWGASKDFAMSGLRCGVLVTENALLREVMSGTSMWSSVSTHTQRILAEMWADRPFVEEFVATNRTRLEERYRSLSGYLTDAGIGHHAASAGFFTVVDLRPYLSEPNWEAETLLWRRLLDRTNVNLTPGSACRSPQPGLFRLCFASVSDAALKEGVSRIADHLAAM